MTHRMHKLLRIFNWVLGDGARAREGHARTTYFCIRARAQTMSFRIRNAQVNSLFISCISRNLLYLFR